jgi:DNA-binding GntR family transcriptional regulator
VRARATQGIAMNVAHTMLHRVSPLHSSRCSRNIVTARIVPGKLRKFIDEAARSARGHRMLLNDKPLSWLRSIKVKSALLGSGQYRGATMSKETKSHGEELAGVKAKRMSAQQRAEGNAAQTVSGVAATLRRLLTGENPSDSLVVSIAYELGLDIIEGRLKPGDDLNSVDLAERFSISRTPVREALALLEKQGLVEVLPRRRPRVRGVSIEELRNIYEIRAAMHALVCELVAERASDDDIALLRRAFEAMREAAESGDVHQYFVANMAFHDTATDICRNPMLQRSLDLLGLTTFNLRYQSLSQTGRIKRSLEDHCLLMRAFEERNPTLASAIIRSNIQSALKALEHSFDK